MKIIYYILILRAIAPAIIFELILPGSLSAQYIITGTVASPLCAGSVISVPFTTGGPYNPGNVFTAQLSNASGSFTSPIAIGTLAATGAGTISCTIPAGTVTGSAYRIEVASSNPVTTGSNNGTNILINAFSATISGGTSSVCYNNSPGVYTVTAAGGEPYTDLVNFTGLTGTAPGDLPYGNLTQAKNGLLYGMTNDGGAGGAGNIFSYNPVTATYNDLFDFVPAANGEAINDSGQYPAGTLVQGNNGLLYGMAGSGGPYGDGVLFSYNPNNNTYIDLLNFNGPNGAKPGGSLLQATNGLLYGTTSFGGVYNNRVSVNNSGVLFSYNPATSTYLKLVDFDSTATAGQFPESYLMQATNGLIYGMTSAGGVHDGGIIFSYNPSNGSLKDVFDFSLTGGNSVFEGLIQANNGLIYGMNGQDAGANNAGYIFSFNPDSNTCKDVHDFSQVTGWFPVASLTQAGNGLIYGLTPAGGANGDGVLFSLNPTGNTYTDLFDFTGNGIGSFGASPEGSLIQAGNGLLYGMTNAGGAHSDGVLFSYNLQDTYSWYLNDIPTGITTQTYTPVNLIATSTVYCEVTSNACTLNTKIDTIKVSPVPNATITAGGPTTFCSGDSVTLISNSGTGFKYLWSNAATTQAITAITSGSYDVTVINASACSAISSATVVKVDALPKATITAGSATTFCEGGSVTLTAKSGTNYKYKWSNTATTKAIAATTSGNYDVTVTNANGCQKTSAAKKIIIDALPAATIKVTKNTVCSGGTAILTANTGIGYKYIWSTGITTRADTVKASGTYDVTVTNKDACSASASNILTCAVDVADKTDSNQNATDIPASNNEGFDVSVYPNPYNGEFHLKVASGSTSNINIAIYDVLGRLMEQQKEITYGTDVLLGNRYAAGVYVVRVQQSGAIKEVKVVKSE